MLCVHDRRGLAPNLPTFSSAQRTGQPKSLPVYIVSDKPGEPSLPSLVAGHLAFMEVPAGHRNSLVCLMQFIVRPDWQM